MVGPFEIWQFPDYEGGHDLYPTIPNYQNSWEENEDHSFQYCVWAGTPLEFAKQLPKLYDHKEPSYEEPLDILVTPKEILKWAIKNGLRK
jgi:hypothetical protein